MVQMEEEKEKAIFGKAQPVLRLCWWRRANEAIASSDSRFRRVEVEVPCWKLAVVLNDQLMFQGDNPLGFDGCPFIPVFWNYEPHINYYDLRARGLVRTMRDSNYLMNRQIIINHDIRKQRLMPVISESRRCGQ